MPGPQGNALLPFSRHRGRRPYLVLPRECTLPAPRLPAGRTWSRYERRLWRDLWRSPQASQWDESFGPAVASYVMFSVAIWGGRATAWQAQEARHLADRLGLTPAGMAARGWALEDAS